jgi:hypothetical protein
MFFNPGANYQISGLHALLVTAAMLGYLLGLEGEWAWMTSAFTFTVIAQMITYRWFPHIMVRFMIHLFFCFCFFFFFYFFTK